MYDICIIGAGVVGMNIARYLSRYELKVCVVERQEDVGCGCSKANSGIVHGGYSDEPGSLKAELCVKGNSMYEQLEKELNFGYRKTGSLVVTFRDDELPALQRLAEQGRQNGVKGLAVISGDEARKMEPHLSTDVCAALYCENAGVTSPYELVIALAENAVVNGVVLKLNTEATNIMRLDHYFKIFADNGEEISSRYIINAAGIHSDKIARMVGIDEYKITPRRGQYILLDKDQNYLAKSVIFQVPTKLGKGILVTTTYHGNLMLGPNAEEIEDKEDLSTDETTLKFIIDTARRSVPDFNIKKALKSFAGNRPVSNKKDWVIEESKVKGFINLIGIDSPGLTSSPAIALKVADILQAAGISFQPKKNFEPLRKPIIIKKADNFSGDINASDPKQHIICRCEQVTETEIIDCLHRGIPINSLEAVARRTRAGMGRCQGTFCGPRVREVIARQLTISPEDVPGRGEASSTLVQRVNRLNILKL